MSTKDTKKRDASSCSLYFVVYELELPRPRSHANASSPGPLFILPSTRLLSPVADQKQDGRAFHVQRADIHEDAAGGKAIALARLKAQANGWIVVNVREKACRQFAMGGGGRRAGEALGEQVVNLLRRQVHQHGRDRFIAKVN